MMPHLSKTHAGFLRAIVFAVTTLVAGTAFAQSSPPAVGTSGTAGRVSGDSWTVCRADTSTAWIAANSGGSYNAVEACQSVGYTSVTRWGGTCGTVCGYCGTPGSETYDGSGATDPTLIRFTVHWECSGFVGDEEEEDTVDATQDARARFGLDRARSLISNQPDLTPMLSGSSAGRVSAQVGRSAGNLDLATDPSRPVWASLTASWSDTDGADGTYILGAAGMHWALTPDIFVGGMVQIDRAEWEDGDASAEGDGWLVGPYLLARFPEKKLYFDARLLVGRADNEISPLGTYTDSFSSDRMLARVKLAGEVKHGAVSYYPNVVLAHTRDRQEAYTDGNDDRIAAQDVWLTDISYGFDFTMPYREVELFGGVSGILSDIGGDGAAEALAQTYDGMRAAVRLGFSHTFDAGARLRAETFYDGIGASDYENYGLDVMLSFDF